MGFLRFILAFVATSAHVGTSGWPYVGSASAIQAFVVISGFYAALLLTERYDPNLPRDIRSFYLSRFLRLYPSFIFATALTILWSWRLAEINPELWSPLKNLDLVTEGLSLPATLLIWLPNIALVGVDFLPLFNLIDGYRVEVAPSWVPTPPYCPEMMWLGFALIIPPSWSLGLIFSFYLITPVILRTPSVLRCLAWGTLSMTAWLVFGPLFFYGGYFVGAFFYWLFCLGAISFFAYRRFRHVLEKWASSPLIKASMFFLPVFVLVWMFTMNSEVGPTSRALIISGMLPFSAVASRHLALDRYVGRLSYPVFCFHMLMISISEAFVVELDLSTRLVFPVTLAGSLILSALTVRYIETPLENLRSCLRSHRKA